MYAIKKKFFKSEPKGKKKKEKRERKRELEPNSIIQTITILIFPRSLLYKTVFELHLPLTKT